MSEITIFGSRLSPFVEKVCGAAAYKRIPFALSPFVPGPARPGPSQDRCCDA